MRELGYNYRLSDISSALGLSQLSKLDTFIQQRIALASYYDKSFSGTIIKPLYPFNADSSYHLYVVQVDFTKTKITKEQLFIKMKEKNIGLQLHYMPINKQPYYKSLGYGNEKTPIMDIYYKQAFSLPLYVTLTNKEQEYIIKTLFEVFSKRV